MSEFSDVERHPIFPIFLLLDVSLSMQGPPIDAINIALPELKRAIEEDPTTGELARVGLITFADSARLAIPLSDLADVQLPCVKAEGRYTNFADAFASARKYIESGVKNMGKGTRFFTPVIFLITDGRHNWHEDWRSAHARILDRSWKFRSEIVVFGFGSASPEEIRALGSRPHLTFLARDQAAASVVKEIISTLLGSIKTTSGSIRAGQPQLIVDVDQTKFVHLDTGQV
jgi:uncharacterized protein YegL